MVKDEFRNGMKWSYVGQTVIRNAKGKLVKGGYYVAAGNGTTNWYNKSKYGIKTKAAAIKYARMVIK